MVDSFDAIFYTLGFIVPGFIIDIITRRFIPKKDPSSQNSILTFLSLSFLNYAIWSGLIYIVFKVDYFASRPIATGIVWFVVIFVSPLFISYFILRMYRDKKMDKISKWLNMNYVHAIPTAWDNKFITMQQDKWVIVSLDDGTSIAGFWSIGSIASSDPQERDIYIKETYTIDEHGEWHVVPYTDGVWIKANAIRHIQFINYEMKGEH